MTTAPDEAESPEAIERVWLEQTYRGDAVPQLTLRAVGMGAVLGLLTGLSNLYVGLKIGWSLGVVVTASIVGFALWELGVRLSLLRARPSELEVNAMASVASASGYSTGTTLVSSIAAYLLVAGHHLPLWQLTAWIGSVSTLGLFLAIPLKRPLINIERLPFPSGAAAAETIQSLHAADADAAERARLLFRALAVGLALKWMTAVMPLLVDSLGTPTWLVLPSSLPTDSMIAAAPVLGTMAAYTWTLELSALLPAAGVLVGWRVGWSMLLGAVVCFAFVAPSLVGAGVVASAGYRDIVDWTVWPGTIMMVVAGLLSFVANRAAIGRALRGLLPTAGAGVDPLADIEVPARWFGVGVLCSGTSCVVLLWALFDVAPYIGVLAVVLACLLAAVAARVAGETDIVPMGAMGKIGQLTFGGLLPGRALPNLMTAGISAGAAASAADLLTDLKSGHLLGANPRKQFLAQLIGVGVGTIAIVPVFRYVLVPSVDVLGTAQWPAPAARIWASVARLVSVGVEGLPVSALWAMAAAAAFAACLAIAAERLPEYRAYIPNPTGVGLAFVLPAMNSMAFFAGGFVALLVARRAPTATARRVVPIAAGLIAGESLMGIVGALLQAS